LLGSTICDISLFCYCQGSGKAAGQQEQARLTEHRLLNRVIKNSAVSSITQ
jgi:hypothetical protein